MKHIKLISAIPKHSDEFEKHNIVTEIRVLRFLIRTMQLIHHDELQVKILCFSWNSIASSLWWSKIKY